MRLVIILLLLVVLPTALLSVLAGRSIQAREVILHDRLERDAVKLIDDACDRFRVLIGDDADRVASTFLETVLAGMQVERGPGLDNSLRGQCAFVKRVYLFMNPWGFVFPQLPDPGEDDRITADVLLRQDLIDRLSTGRGALETKISLRREDRIYCFQSVPDFSGIYSGFEVDLDAILAWAETAVSQVSTEDIVLRVTVVDENGAGGEDGDDDIAVSDSLSPQPGRPVSGGAERGGDEGVLAFGRLPLPLTHIRVSASLVREDDIRRAEALEARLIGWGILLLAIVIMTSSTMLIRRTMQQAAVARRRSEFVIGMSHDLRTPIASLRVLADSLSAGRIQDPEKQKRFLRTIASECERLGDMIERILFFFRQEHRAMSYTMSRFDIGETVAHTVASFRERQLGRIEVSLDLPAEPMLVVGDAEALTKVITNLLDNAAKYGASRGEESEHAEGHHAIAVSVDRARQRFREWIRITVEDEGPGIATRERDRIFERFYRSDTETHRHVGGIGLGLSLCADIVRAHRGRITVASEEGKGAAFTVWLRSKAAE
jgi:signal transduction histidine kinase